MKINSVSFKYRI